jgi:hypothetical protein
MNVLGHHNVSNHHETVPPPKGSATAATSVPPLLRRLTRYRPLGSSSLMSVIVVSLAHGALFSLHFF